MLRGLELLSLYLELWAGLGEEDEGRGHIAFVAAVGQVMVGLSVPRSFIVSLDFDPPPRLYKIFDRGRQVTLLTKRVIAAGQGQG